MARASATVLSYTRDGRLLLWDSPQHGGRQIAEGLPEGSLLWCSSQWEDDTLRLVVGKRSHRGLLALTYDRRLGELDFVTLKLTGTQPQAVIGHQGWAYVFYADSLDVLSLATGEIEGNHSLRHYPGVKSLFFPLDARGLRRWVMMAHDPDSQINFMQPVFTETEKIQLIGMTHSVGHEGPLGITTRGEVLDPATGRLAGPDSYHVPPIPRPQPPYARSGSPAMDRGPSCEISVDLPPARPCFCNCPRGRSIPPSLAVPETLSSPFSGRLIRALSAAGSPRSAWARPAIGPRVVPQPLVADLPGSRRNAQSAFRSRLSRVCFWRR